MTRAVLIDDSGFMRRVIKDILSQNSIEVVAEAENGFEGIKKVIELKPDVVLLDIEMPVLTGLDTLSLIMKKCPTPVVMFSSLTKEGADVTMEALKLGAIDFLQKPKTSLDVYALKDQLVDKIKTSAKAKVKDSSKEIKIQKKVKTLREVSHGQPNRICVIGCSTGGPKALTQIFEKMEYLNQSIFIVQHMPAFFTKTLAKRLNDITPFIVKEAEDKEEIKNGVVYLAPGDNHMEIVEHNGYKIISLNKDPALHGCRPAVDYLFKSAASIFKEKLLACVLTGMGKDGLDGSQWVKNQKGLVYVESEETCTIYGMPKQVAERNLADSILPIDSFAKEINKFLG
ncbi:chemotaxis response regulator protein-glutamate methylesterase [Alkalicella caledoniensis]|uniref:Protein-glutamate methylesterase/protein-glutamine glutaminase n=1 Tax=Alkalicella caledoniensis TaxID=2731377 RepID=A0A7G9W4T1_ALKCA|nr:chemotaxis response regulator protein-glutamate methylesterase [Alkalicella caledoniensis]QNO13693.1 chemotaxis response regulator protein-glutamate methylesterase [Alkalicella caledoniensis]